MSTSRLYMLTGERGAGKTLFCRSLANHARHNGWDTAGLISPALFDGEQKTGILAEDVRTGETHVLASTKPSPSFDLPLGKWHFDLSTLAWGNHVIEHSLPCDLLILDELGPLEFTHKGGWKAALGTLHSDGYKIALVVIRPELSNLAHTLFTFSETLKIEPTHTADYWLHLYWPKLMECIP